MPTITLFKFARTVKNLSILESESNCAINWFRDNSMIVNPDKFQAILLGKRNSDLHLNENITIDKENIKVVSNVKMLGVHSDSKLSFNLHTVNCIKSTKCSCAIENVFGSWGKVCACKQFYLLKF